MWGSVKLWYNDFLFPRIRCDKSDCELSIFSLKHGHQISHNSLPHLDEHFENNMDMDKKSDSENNGKYLKAMIVHSQRSQCSLDSPILQKFINQRIRGGFDIQFDNIWPYVLSFVECVWILITII